MTSEHQDTLRLQSCPQCGYDLSGLPLSHTCPECGRAYDETMFMVTGMARTARQAPWESIAYLAWVLAFGASATLGVNVSGLPCGIWFAALLAIAAGGWLHRRHAGRTHGGDTTLVFTLDGVEMLGPAGKGMQPWRKFSHVHVRPNLARKRARPPKRWRLIIVRRWWRLLPTLPRHDLYVKLSQPQMKALRDEIARRIEAARRR